MTDYRIPRYQVKLARDGSVTTDAKQIRSPLDAIDVARSMFDGADREHLIVIMLDTKNKIIGVNTVTIGTLNSTVVSMREVFKPAILSNAAGIIVAHNHPSGDPTPSSEDIRITEDMVKAGDILDIAVLDHLVVCDASFISMRTQRLGFRI